MTLTRRQRRAVDRKVGRRELDRKAKTIAARIRELDGQGFEPPTIARSTGLPEAVVRLVLREEEGEGRISPSCPNESEQAALPTGPGEGVPSVD